MTPTRSRIPLPRLPLISWLLLCCWAVGCGSDSVARYKPRTRTYYVAAEEVVWDYAPLGTDPLFESALPSPWGDQTRYQKLRYIGYEDAGFEHRAEEPAWQGVLGPTLRGVVGDTLKVVFLNRTHRPLTMHPHGLRYDEDNEGVAHGSHQHGVAAPGEQVTYTWQVRQDAGPNPNEPSSKVWLYHSHVNAEDEIYRGLVGSIVVTDPARAGSDGAPVDVDREFVTLFMVFNENQTSAGDGDDDGDEDDDEALAPAQEGNLKHAINGRIFANLQGLEMNQGERVRWYVLALGSERDLHTAHWHGEVFSDESGRTSDVLELLPASMRVVDMMPDNPGSWMFHCHIGDHITAGMYTSFLVM